MAESSQQSARKSKPFSRSTLKLSAEEFYRKRRESQRDNCVNISQSCRAFAGIVRLCMRAIWRATGGETETEHLAMGATQTGRNS